jgi:tetratricopeptide (TPR) repeat protein
VSKFDEAIRKDPKHYKAFNNRGLALFELGDVATALDSLDKAIDIRPAYFEALFNKGTILEAAGRTEEAQKVFEKARAARGPDEKEE